MNNTGMINKEKFQNIKEKVENTISLVYDKTKVDTQSKIFNFRLIIAFKSLNA